MEALVALGLTSNVVQFVDFSSKMISQISAYSSAAGGVPKKLQRLEAQLKLVDQIIESLDAESLRSVDQEKQTISLCVDQIQEFNALLDKSRIQPQPNSDSGASWITRQRGRVELTWKAFKSLRGQEKIEEFQKSLDRLLALLTLQLQIKSNVTADGSSKQVLSKLDQLQLSRDQKDEAQKQPTIKHTIPFLRNPDFVARKGLTDAIEQRFTSGEPKVVLYGLGGAGKTQIALDYAFGISSASSIFWVYANSDANVKDSYQRIATVCDIPGRQDPQANLMQLVRDWLESSKAHKWLMVIDNVDSADILFSKPVNEKTLAEYIPTASQGSILYTSRNRDVAIDILHVGSPIEIGPMSPEEARELLIVNDFSRSNEEDISALLQDLEYIPLAITQAAAYMSKRQKSAGHYLDLFRSSDSNKARLLAYEFNEHGREARSRESVAKTWMISFDHIKDGNSGASDMLSLMSCYDQQGIPPILFRNVGMDDFDYVEAIGILRAFSLIKPSDSVATYSMHRLVQIAMTTWLSVHSSQTQTAYMSRALEILAVQFPVINNSSQTRLTKLNQARALFPHAGKVLAYCSAQSGLENKTHLLELLIKTGYFLHQLGRYDEALTKAEEARVLKSTSGTVVSDKFPMEKIIHLLGWVHVGKGDYNAAVELLQPFWESVMEGPYRTAQVNFTGVLASALMYKEEYSLAKSYVEKCISKAQVSAQSDNSISVLYRRLGDIEYSQDNYAEAEQLYLRVLSTYGIEPSTLTVEGLRSDVQIGRGKKFRWILQALQSLGRVLHKLGRREEAESLLRTSLTLCEEFYGLMHIDTISTVSDLADVLWEAGECDNAGLMYERAYRDSEENLGPDHPRTLGYKRELEEVRMKMEESKKKNSETEDSEVEDSDWEGYESEESGTQDD